MGSTDTLNSGFFKQFVSGKGFLKPKQVKKLYRYKICITKGKIFFCETL